VHVQYKIGFRGGDAFTNFLCPAFFVRVATTLITTVEIPLDIAYFVGIGARIADDEIDMFEQWRALL
jgi:hypothetical protein